MRKKVYKYSKKQISYNERRKQRNAEAWRSFFPKHAKCEICNRDLKYYSKNINNSIHFDHKTEKYSSIKRPSQWLRQHTRSIKNERKWRSFNFGILCLKCNRRLLLSKRKEFLRNEVKYVFGKDYKIVR